MNRRKFLKSVAALSASALLPVSNSGFSPLKSDIQEFKYWTFPVGYSPGDIIQASNGVFYKAMQKGNFNHG